MAPRPPLSSLFLWAAAPAVIQAAAILSPRESNGLAVTPPMGWNSYNHYSCAPNETIIHSNAQALLDLGLASLGYDLVTVDCGWSLPNRLSNGSLTWNTDRFPSGYPALGDFLHSKTLKFGVYADSGIETCMTGSPAQAGSLYHEQTDAMTFASWGADSVKFDNCYSEASAGYPNVDYTPSVSPSGRYQNMSNAMLATGRDMLFLVCDWGVDFPSLWAPKLGHTWRIANDITPSYHSIPRILNQAVPQTSFAGPGQWLDLDMLEVGNGVLSIPEEQTHFSLWAIVKSPLVIGCALKDASTSVNSASLAILKNSDVVSYNQDSLGQAASFRRRWTADGFELWAGPLSGNRTVAAIINLTNSSRSLTLNLPDVGYQAANVKDVWNAVTKTNVRTSYSANVAGHGTMLLELSNTVPAGTYGSAFATTAGSVTTFQNVYGITSSPNYEVTIYFKAAFRETGTITVSGSSTTKTKYTVPAHSSSIKVPLGLNASAQNSVSVDSPVAVTELVITEPANSFHSSADFSLGGPASRTTCTSGYCAPAGTKIGYLSPSGSASISIPARSDDLATKPRYVEVIFCNNDISFSTSWTTGTNTRNLTLTVNGVTTRIETPLSGRSSELFGVGKGWEDSGSFGVLLEGWGTGDGSDVITVGNVNGTAGVQSYGADFVGIYVWD